VEEITLNYTKLITPDGHLVMLPNKALADSQMINYTALGRRRVTQVVTASYDTPAEAVKAACYLALERTEKVLADPAPAVYVTNYGASSIEYTIYCWSNAADFLAVKFGLCENLRPAFAEKGAEMCYDPSEHPHRGKTGLSGSFFPNPLTNPGVLHYNSKKAMMERDGDRRPQRAGGR